MAVYQLGFYAFGALAISNVAGPGGIQLTTNTTQGIGTPGERFQTLDSTSAVTTIRVQDDDATSTDGSVNESGLRARIAPGSPFGAVNAVVDLEYRITVVTDEPVPRALTYYVLSIGGVNVGLVGTEPLIPGVRYTVQTATDQETATTLRSYGTQGVIPPDTAGQNALAWDAVFCFTHGTLIDTPQGPRLIEDLVPGDLVTTLANGSQPLRWVGTRALTAADLRARPELCPIRIEAGVLGNARPLLVSPQHRVLISDWQAQVYFGEDQVLIAAKALENGRTIRPILPEAGVVYCHLLFDRHEVILAEGALSESFHPGEIGLEALDGAQRAEIAALFPGLDITQRRAAFPIVTPTEARALRLPA
jgi:hypothetical protein